MAEPETDLEDLLDPTLDVEGRSATVLGRFFGGGSVVLPRRNEAPFRCRRSRLGRPESWFAYHLLGADADSLEIQAALVDDLRLVLDPALLDATTRLLTSTDAKAALKASRSLGRKGRGATVADVVAAADRLVPHWVPSEHPQDPNAWPATRLLSMARAFSRATGARQTDLRWARQIDPRLWYAMGAAFGSRPETVPAFGIAATFHWNAECRSGGPLVVPRLEKAVSALVAWARDRP